MRLTETISTAPWLARRPSRPWLLAVAAVTLGVLISVVLLAAPNVLYGLGIVGGVIGGVAALLWPPLAVYALTADIIATWPQSAPKFIGALLVLSLTWRILSGKKRPGKDRLLLVMLVFNVIVWISMAFSPTKRAITTTALTYTSFLVMYWAFVTLLDTEKLIKRTIVALIAAAVAAALIGIAQAFMRFSLPTSLYRNVPALSKMSLLQAQGFMGLLRIDSVAGQPVLFAISLQCVFPFVLLLLREAYRARKKLLTLVVLGIFLLLFAAWTQTYARTSFVAVAVMALWGASKYGARTVALILLVSALVIGSVFVVSQPLRDRAIATLTAQEEAGAYTSSVSWRLSMWRVGWSVFVDHPVTGIGPGQFQYIVRSYLPNDRLIPPGYAVISPVHNTFLAMAIDLGVGGFLLYLVMLWMSFKALWRAQRELRARGRPRTADLAVAVEVSLVGLVVAMVFADLERFRYTWFLIALAGAVGGLARSYAARGAVTPDGSTVAAANSLGRRRDAPGGLR